MAGIFIKTMNARYGLTLPGFTQAEWLSIFTNDPFIDKDGDGKVKGRSGDGLLETLAPLLGFSGDSNDSLADEAVQSAEAGETAVQVLEQTWGTHIPRAAEDGNRAAAVAAVRRLLGLGN